jgi:hypothetical protein
MSAGRWSKRSTRHRSAVARLAAWQLAWLALGACSALVSFDDLHFESGAASVTSGGGQLAKGAPCSAADECASGHCVDGVCCEGVCDEVCQACNVQQSEGTCLLVPEGTFEETCQGVCDGEGRCRSGAPLWSHATGDENDQLVFSVAVDDDGGVIAAGTFSGMIDLGGEPMLAVGKDGFVVKFDATGLHQWAWQTPSRGDEAINDIAIASDGSIVVTGIFSSSFSFETFSLTAAEAPLTSMVIVLGPDGVVSDAFDLGLPDYFVAREIALSPEGEIYLSGFHQAAGTFCGLGLQADTPDIFVMRLAAVGGCLTMNAFGGDSEDIPDDMAVDAEGNLYLAGGFASTTINFQVGPEHQNVVSGNPNAFVVALDGQSLTTEWAKSFGAEDDDRIFDIEVSGDDLLLAGVFAQSVTLDGFRLQSRLGSYDGLVARLGRDDGAVLAAVPYGGAGHDSLQGVAVDGDGNILLSGHSDSIDLDMGGGVLAPGGGFDLIVAKYDTAGGHVWSARYGGNDDQVAPGAQGVSPQGNLALGAAFRGTLPFGADVHQAAARGTDAYDIFIGSFEP